MSNFYISTQLDVATKLGPKAESVRMLEGLRDFILAMGFSMTKNLNIEEEDHDSAVVWLSDSANYAKIMSCFSTDCPSS